MKTRFNVTNLTDAQATSARGFHSCLHVATLLEKKVLYRTLKGSSNATYLEPLKGSIHS